MASESDWTAAEFERLLDTETWAAGQIRRRFPGRSLAEIARLRGALHAFHTVGDTAMLSPLMHQVLVARRRGQVRCSVCGAVF